MISYTLMDFSVMGSTKDGRGQPLKRLSVLILTITANSSLFGMDALPANQARAVFHMVAYGKSCSMSKITNPNCHGDLSREVMAMSAYTHKQFLTKDISMSVCKQLRNQASYRRSHTPVIFFCNVGAHA